MPQVTFDDLVAGVCSGQHLISFLTDTVPALAARPDCAEQLFQAKQRCLDKPLILMAGRSEDLWQYVAGSAAEREIWHQVVNRYLPGALTLVLPASDRVPTSMNPTDPTTIGVRVPNHAIAQTILNHTGPLATTSANRSGSPTLQTMAEIEAHFPQVLTLAREAFHYLQPVQYPTLPQTQATSGIPSTVVRWTESGWEILRQGAIAFSSDHCHR